ncbi:MAG: hypothetical protein NTZ25_05190 [Candidatus Peregrinibacteria bacterium]|nr:hypothetical protein [Candidatus Peregrinibacteria bacterium]
MAVLKAAYEFLFVGRDDNSFLENYAYDLFQDHGEKSGQIFINLEIQNNPVDAEEIAQTIFETMQKGFFEDLDKEPYGRFEAALKSINGVLAKFKAEKTSGYIGNLNVIVAAIVGDELFLAQAGDAEAYLIRKRYISIVSEGLSEESTGEDVFSTIANGKIEEGDVVMFSSTRLIRYIGKSDLAEAVHRKDMPQALANVRDIIATEILGRVGLTGVSFSKANKEDVESVEDGEDHVSRGMLEADEVGVSASRNTLTGKFLSVFKRDSAKRSGGVTRLGGDMVAKVGGFFSEFKDSIMGRVPGGLDKGLGKNKILALLVGVIVVLGVLVMFANSNRVEKAQLQKYDQLLSGVQDKLTDATTKSSTDKAGAKDVLDKAYLDAKSVLDSGFYREKATIYLLQIEETRDKLDNVTRVVNPKVVADLATKRADVNALGFVTLADRVFVYEYNALYELVLDQIQAPVTIDKDESVIAAAGFDDQKSIIFLTKGGKMIQFKDGTMNFMDSEDGAFHKGSALATWSNKVYVLDSAANQIWKYTYKGINNKFGKGEAYISDKTDVSKVQDFAIDANVWLLQTTGDILKLYGGAKASFFINNAPFSNLVDPKVIYTNDKLKQVFVLDGREARVLVYSKDTQNTGNLDYKTQYLFDGVGDLRDLYVDAGSKKLYVLTKTKILEQDL